MRASVPYRHNRSWEGVRTLMDYWRLRPVGDLTAGLWYGRLVEDSFLLVLLYARCESARRTERVIGRRLWVRTGAHLQAHRATAPMLK